EGIKISNDIVNMQFINDIMVVNYSDKLKKQIDELGKRLLIKNQKMDWSITLNHIERLKLEVSYRFMEQIIDDKVEKISESFYKNMKIILFHIRKAYNVNSLDDICNNLNNLNIV
ncbi:14184_t:CDS:1, partial [Cetraspora pellucida]